MDYDSITTQIPFAHNSVGRTDQTKFFPPGQRFAYATDLYLKLAALGSSALIFTTIALLAITSTLTTGKIDGLYIGLIILIFESICFGLPFLAMRWSVQNLKSDLEDDLRNIRE